MKLNTLEMTLIKMMFEEFKVQDANNLENIQIKSRKHTQVGFFTEILEHQSLYFDSRDKDFKWGKLGAKLNDRKIESGFLFYVENNYLRMIEGYTYDDLWPRKLYNFEIYKIEKKT